MRSSRLPSYYEWPDHVLRHVEAEYINTPDRIIHVGLITDKRLEMRPQRAVLLELTAASRYRKRPTHVRSRFGIHHGHHCRPE